MTINNISYRDIHRSQASPDPLPPRRGRRPPSLTHSSLRPDTTSCGIASTPLTFRANSLAERKEEKRNGDQDRRNAPEYRDAPVHSDALEHRLHKERECSRQDGS